MPDFISPAQLPPPYICGVFSARLDKAFTFQDPASEVGNCPCCAVCTVRNEYIYMPLMCKCVYSINDIIVNQIAIN